jgi:hypothetical protein
MFTEKSLMRDEIGNPFNHHHKVDIDGGGTGKTTNTYNAPPHTHEIKDFVVKPADSFDNHTHELNQAYPESISYREGQKPRVLRKNPGVSVADRFRLHPNKKIEQPNIEAVTEPQHHTEVNVSLKIPHTKI